MNITKVCQAIFILATALLTACAGTSPSTDETVEAVPSYQQLDFSNNDQQGSIFRSASAVGFYEDVKARRVGDILTILLVEQTTGQNSADNSVNQSTDLNIAAPSFNGATRPDLAVDLGSENSFSGESGSSQSNSLSGSIAVTVHQVLPNGNLVVEGEKWIRINQANEYVRLEGVVRAVDVSTNNSLLSTQVADARISYGGKGAHGNTPGWAAKIIFSPLWPF
ncbi:MAG: flagellar basal body L-ring protein FlgH [Halieaceae bacterium]|nr:flagellar basal body L-ring protein FlgH [Halieaceae bacterium]